MEKREYQDRAKDAVAKALIDDGINRLLLQSATGTGKTTLAGSLLTHERIHGWMASNRRGKGAQMLWIAHREELIDQAASRIRQLNPGLMVSIEKGDQYANRWSDVVVASIQTLAARKFIRLKRLLQHHQPALVIADEAHHASADTWRTTLVYLGFLPQADASESTEIEAAKFDDVKKMAEALRGWDEIAPRDRVLIGLTATPNRSDAVGLQCVFQSLVFSYPLKQAIDDGWLVPIVPWEIDTTENLDSVRTTHGEFNQKDLAEAVNTPRRNDLAVTGWQRYAAGRPTLAFTVDVQHAHDLAEMFNARGIKARALSGETPSEERRQMLRDYRERRIDVITNCMVLTEGTDLPLTACILHAKPTKSATLYEQMTGRGLRILDGKADCIVLDVVDISRKHSLQTAPTLYGLPPSVLASGKDLRKVVDDLEQLREQFPAMDVDAELEKGRFSVADLEKRARTFDVWAIPSLGEYATILTLDWVRVASDRFRLQYPWSDGTEILTVEPDVLNHYDLVATMRPQEASGNVRQRTIATGLGSASEALALGEAYVRDYRPSVTKLKNRDAPWKARHASEKQIAFLQKLHIPHNPKTVTMGQASHLIDIARAKKGR